MSDLKVNEVEKYISTFPEPVCTLLNKMKDTIQAIVPSAELVISYGIPTFKLDGNLVHFGGFKNHIGFYPGPSGIKPFTKELSGYKGAKGSIQFPIDRPLPLDLVKAITVLRVKENIEKSSLKSKKEKICSNGHKYTKTSDCPTCPFCEAAKKPSVGFLSNLSAPAKRALANNGIKTLKQLASLSEKEVLCFHGMGPASIPVLKTALKDANLKFKQ